MPPRRKRTKVEAAAQIASSSSSITVDASSTRSSVTVDGEVEPSHPQSPATLAVEVVASDEDSDHLFEPPTTRRKRQRTLDGGNANTPPRKAPPVHGRGQRETPPAAVTSSGGELLPSRKTSSTSSPASSAPLPSFSAEELEAGLVQQLQQANLLAALDRRDIFTTTYEECLHGVDAEDDSEADEGVRNRTFRAPQAWPQQGDIAHFRMAFPCVQRFIIRECQRVARRALDEDNATSAICYASPEDAAREMLGFFTNLLSENDGGLMLLLFLSCPSCRWAGAEVMTEMIGLYELLARSHRYEPSRHPWLKPEDLISSFSFTGTHDESCSCPFGGSHSLIASLLRSSMGSVVVNVSFASLRDVLPMNECLAVYKERVNQLDRILRNKPPPRQSKKKSPPAPHTRSLLAVLDGIVSSEERLEGSSAFISSSFDEDVRTVMDTLVRRKMLFDVTIRVRSECQRCSIQQGSLRIDPWRINVESAMLLMHVGNHVALSLDRHQPQSCQCSSTPMDVSTTEGRELFAMIEFHDAYLMKLRACRAEMNSIAVERTEHDTRQSYAAGSHELFRQQALSVQGMTVRDIVSFAAACNPDAEDNRDEGSVRPPPTIRASLHPHQLENLDQMLAREEFGSTEYTEIPVWSPPMSMKGDAIQRGTFLYCAAVAECIFFPH